MLSPPPTPPSAKGSVLLIEEYGALAAAIRAALKKFAPSHAVSRVRSLSAALTAAQAKPPDLVILDFDPPFAGILRFFSELREIAPGARVMVIAANLPQTILRDDRLPAAFAFVEKPFQLAELGAAIAQLISASDPAHESSARTALEAMSLSDVIPLLGIESLTGTVGVTAAEGALVGELAFDRGAIPTATASGLLGIDALREMLRWPAPEFDFTEGMAPAPPQIEGKWPRVLERVICSIPHPLPASSAKTVRKRSGRAIRAKPTPPVAQDGKKILIIDDTETLRIFVHEMLSESDPRLQIFAAPDATTGVQQCSALKPDLILLDFSLPDFNGDEVCRRLLANEATQAIPIIMMSGHVADMAEAAAQYDNIVLTLSKPFVSADLIEAVGKTLAKLPQRRLKTSSIEAKPDLPAAKPSHETNGHAARPTPATTVAVPSPAAPLPEPAPLTTPEPPPSLHPAVSSFAPESPVPEPAMIPLPAPGLPGSALVPAHIALASRDAVVLTLDLEVLRMQFSPTLQITHLHARPASSAVFLHVDPRAVSAVPVPEIAFAISQVLLDAHGQLHTLAIVPALRPLPIAPPPESVSIEQSSILHPGGQERLQLTPAATAHFTIRLMAAFDLAGVELSSSFGVSLFRLRARSTRLRVVLPAHGGRGGSVFVATRIALTAAGGIAEIELALAPAAETPALPT